MIDESLAHVAEGLRQAKSPCVTSSFQADCVVLLHVLRAVRPDIPVLFIDTAHHFTETTAYAQRLAKAWSLNLVTVRSTSPHQGLWQQSTESCCAHHKTGPLFAALEEFDTWFTALRREQSPTRSALEANGTFRLPSGKQLHKVNPLLGWTLRDVLSYAHVHEIPLLPLYERGYTSIGCFPCTQLPSDPSDPRSGRWGGARKECGIHIEPQA
jgi:phosphoadenosine phosphosulfate reductase